MSRSRRAPKFRKGQEVAKTHRDGSVSCFRFIALRDKGTRIEVARLYFAKRFSNWSIEPIEDFRIATERDHELAREHAEHWNTRERDE